MAFLCFYCFFFSFFVILCSPVSILLAISIVSVMTACVLSSFEIIFCFITLLVLLAGTVILVSLLFSVGCFKTIEDCSQVEEDLIFLYEILSAIGSARR